MHRPHFGKSRKIVPGQKIHESVMFKPDYRPKPKFPSGDWPEQLNINEPASYQHLLMLAESHWETDLFDIWPARVLFLQSPQDGIESLVARVAFISSSGPFGSFYICYILMLEGLN